MRVLLISFFMLFTSITAIAADLQNGDRAKYDYSEVAVYKILSARVTVRNQGEDYKIGRLNVRLFVEGNICDGQRFSLGSLEKYSGENRKDVTMLVRHVKVDDLLMCAEYSKETRIVSAFLFDAGNDGPLVYDFNANTVTLTKVNGTWKTTIANRVK